MTSILQSVPILESEVEFAVEGARKLCKTSYTIFGSFPSPAGKRSLVCLHGGPGVPHDCIRNIGNLFLSTGIPVIMYDQLGCGRSTHLPEKKGDESFWTVKLFLQELDNLLSHLGIQDDYDLLGQSWGGDLAADHAIFRPRGLKRLVLASAPASKQLFLEGGVKLLAEFPPDLKAAIERNEAEGILDNPEYLKAKSYYYSHHLCRLNPMPEAMMVSIQDLQKDPTVNHSMNGPYLTKRTGSLRGWSIEDKIHKINVPTLLLSGKYDACQDIAIEPFFNGIEKVKWVKFSESSHFPNIEEPKAYLDILGKFLSHTRVA